MVQKLGKNCHGCSIFELGCASGCASVLPCVHAVSEQRGSLSVCGERPCSPCGDRRRSASSAQGRAPSACIGSPTPGSACGRVCSPFAWKGGARNRLRSLCFPGRSPSAWESGFRAISRIARVAALPPRCPHRPCFLTDKKSKIRACANECVPLSYLLATRTWLSW